LVDYRLLPETRRSNKTADEPEYSEKEGEERNKAVEEAVYWLDYG
jgi:hypothetical protein